MDKCYGGRNGWQTCTSCGGRIHRQDCTSPVNPMRDCCPALHSKLGLPRDSAQVRFPSRQTRSTDRRE